MTQWLILIIISKDSVKSNSRFILKKRPYDNLLWQSEVQYPHFVMNLIFSWETSQILFSQMHISFSFCVFSFQILYKNLLWQMGEREFGLGSFLSPCMSNEQNNFNFLNEEVFLVSLPLHMILYWEGFMSLHPHVFNVNTKTFGT